MNYNDPKKQSADEAETKPAHPAGIKPTEQDAQSRMTDEGDTQNMDEAQAKLGNKNPNKPASSEERSKRADAGDAQEQTGSK